MTYVQLLLRIVVGGVLVYAGFTKAVAPAAEFAALINVYNILPPTITPFLALVLPYVEMWIGLFVLFGVYTRQAALLSGLLFGMFLVVLSSALLRGIDLSSCGCFGADSLSPKQTMLMDVVLLVFSLLIFRIHKYPQKLTLDDVLAVDEKILPKKLTPP